MKLKANTPFVIVSGMNQTAGAVGNGLLQTPKVPLQHSLFFITSLPMELQIMILHQCLISYHPIRNIGEPSRLRPFWSEKRGQEEISPAIIFTCKIYYREGLRIFCKGNQFLYMPFVVTSRRISPHSICKAQKSYPRTFSQIQNLNLMIIYRTRLCFERIAATTAHCLSLFPNLRVLQVDFGKIREGKQGELAISESIRSLFGSARAASTSMKSDGTSGGGLRTLMLPGMPNTDAALHVTRAMATMVRQRGRVGISKGIRGVEYMKLSGREKKSRISTWMDVEQVPEWIRGEQTEP